MKRRNFLQTLGASTLAGTSVFASERQETTGLMLNPPSNRRPNIIVILVDDMGYGDLSCYGSLSIQTPNLDALAAGGVRFTDYHSACPVCSPTRAATLTGRYPQRCGIPEVLTVVRHRDQGLPLDETTFAQLLKNKGYHTGIFGKWHLGYPKKHNPIHYGFDEFRGYISGNVDYISHVDQSGIEDWWHRDKLTPEEGYSTHLITKHSVDFIRRNAEKPFCLYVAHEAPHYPYQGPEDKADRFPNTTFSTHGSRKDVANAYRTMVQEMDKGVGEIMKALRDTNLESDTFIFFCSDNGATKAGSNGNLHGYKGSLWEGGHRVPAIAYWKDHIAPGRTSNKQTISMDIFPTVMAATQYPIPGDLKLDGINLLPYLFADRSTKNRTLFWEFKKQQAVRKGDWKLLIIKQDNEEKFHLFNLKDDLAEKNDLSLERPSIVKDLLAELHQWQATNSS